MSDRDIRIEFASIDARDDFFTGYATVSPCDDDGKLYYKTEAGFVTQVRMQQEYLTRLKALQQEIAAKYLPQINPLEWADYDNQGDFEDRLALERFEQVQAEARVLFPGDTAHYNT